MDKEEKKMERIFPGTRWYHGVREDGREERFGWDLKEEPTAENTGYALILP